MNKVVGNPVRDDYLTAADVVSLMNLVQEQNEKYSSNSDGTIDTKSKNFIQLDVKINYQSWYNYIGNADIQELGKNILEGYYSNGVDQTERYYCGIQMSEQTGRVDKVKIELLNYY